MIKYVISTEIPPPYWHPWLKYGAGFFSNYLRVLQQLVTMEQKYRNEQGQLPVVPYIDWTTSLFVDNNGVVAGLPFPENPKNPWYHWFVGPRQIETNTVVQANSAYDAEVLNHNGNYWRDHNPYVNYLRLIDQRHNILRPHIMYNINEIYNLHFKGHRVLCVMARGNEFRYNHNLQGFWELDFYIQGTKKILSENPDFTKVFLVTDDANWITPFCNEIPITFYCDVFRRTTQTEEYIEKNPYWWADTLRPDHGIRLGEECLIQAHLMAKCNMIFGRQSGTVNGAMLFNENIENYELVGFE